MRFLVLFLLSIVPLTSPAEEFGKYIGDVVAKWNTEDRTMTLVEPFAFIDPAGVQWDAPKGSVVDGASIPRVAWTLIGGPFDGNYRASSVIHDVACEQKKRPWAYVHQTFYNGLRASDVPLVKAKLMYAAVYHFGPRWPEKREVKYKSIVKFPTSICQNSSSGAVTCTSGYENKQIENAITIEEPAQEKTLSENDFQKLKIEIETRENSNDPITLDDIREFK